MEISPFRERNKRMSNIELALLDECQKKLASTKQYVADDKGSFVEMSPYQVMLQTIELFYIALDEA